MTGAAGSLSLRWRGLIIIALPVVVLSAIVVALAYRDQRGMVRSSAYDKANSIVDAITRDSEEIVVLGSHSISVALAERLRAFPSVDEFVLYDDREQGNYTYRRSELPVQSAPLFDGEYVEYGDQHVTVIKRLHNRLGVFGYARIQVHLNRLGQARAATLRSVLWILCGLAVVGLVIALFLHWFIVKPVVSLSRFIYDVTEKDDYELRSTLQDKAELGILRTGIHNLLEHIGEEREHIIALNDELRHSVERAERANRAKSRFLARVNHELRTPLNGIVGGIDLMRSGDLSADEQSEYRDIAYTSCQHLMRVVNDTLTLSSIEEGSQTLKVGPFSIRDCINKLHQLMSIAAQAKKLAFHCAVDRDVPDSVRGDSARLMQILINLVGNACKFTDSGGTVSLEVHSGGVTDERVELYFLVQDTGIGISKDAQSSIFDPYTQDHDSGMNVDEGTGLGLAITAGLVELMGGAISVESERGQGSTFRFSVRMIVCGPEQKAEIASERVVGQAPVRPLHILLVDDNLINLKIAERLLEVDGHTVICCEDGARAVDVFEREPFDLVLMDIHMPVMDGHSAARKIRERERGTGERVPIIALTASALTEEMEKIVRSGMDECIGKPVDRDVMRAMLSRYASS